MALTKEQKEAIEKLLEMREKIILWELQMSWNDWREFNENVHKSDKYAKDFLRYY